MSEIVEFTYIDNQGVSELLTATVGDSLMQVATLHGVSGIDADCGGSCACGTCRIHLDDKLQGRVPAADDDELGVLEFVADGDDRARLGCQIAVTPEFQGTLVKVAT